MDPTKLTMDARSHDQQKSNARADGTGQLGTNSVAWVASGIGPRICFAPEGLASIAGNASGGDAGGAAAGAGSGDGAGSGSAAAAGGDGANAGGDQKPQRPDWLPESLWDGDKGFKQQDFDDLVAFKAERTSAEASRPETADAYEVKLPESFKLPDHIKLEEGQQIVNADDPRVVELRKIAHEKGWSQQDFADVLALGVNMDIAASDRTAASLQAEAGKLGSRAQERIAAVASWVDSKVGKELGSELKGMMFTARQIEAFEKLMSVNRGDVPGTPGAGREHQDPSKIDGFENMSFRQRVAAIDARKSR